ncbi:uncharacterized protein TNCV_4594761 [Trichonephila clavipes]|uniref:MYND-type domain-containing protein n=1 Tax=Trichonephila clavipes TaxID=2585209 RepID=A0A8X6WG50_TRICX|nr:uncharacterized protein TNCV_4594761 [Trichonephila clavipes]
MRCLNDRNVAQYLLEFAINPLPEDSTLEMSCAVCKKPATLRCKQCAKVSYCNTACAKESLANVASFHGLLSPDLTPADFWLWGYLKSWVYQSHSSNLSELKDVIRQELSCIQRDILHSAVAGFVTPLQCVIPCGGGHVEHILL